MSCSKVLAKSKSAAARPLGDAAMLAYRNIKKHYSHLSENVRKHIVWEGMNWDERMKDLVREKASGYLGKDAQEKITLKYILLSPEYAAISDYSKELEIDKALLTTLLCILVYYLQHRALLKPLKRVF